MPRLTATVTVTPPSGEPLSLAQARLHARLGNEADAWLPDAITAAREAAEHQLNLLIRAATYRAEFDVFGEITLSGPGPVALTAISYTDPANAVQSLALSEVDVLDVPGGTAVTPVSGSGWPAGSLPKFTYNVGFADVPKTIQQAIAVHLSYRWDNPTQGTDAMPAFAACLAPHKRWGL